MSYIKDQEGSRSKLISLILSTSWDTILGFDCDARKDGDDNNNEEADDVVAMERLDVNEYGVGSTEDDDDNGSWCQVWYLCLTSRECFFFRETL